MEKLTLEKVSVAEAYLTLLKSRGVDYLFGNAGTDFASIIEALAKSQATGTPAPTPVTCPHENTAQHMAIGYYLATGRPQTTMVHVGVGTANGILGLMNAFRGNVPMLFSAGRAPNSEDTYKGHRTDDINWTQEMYDQAGMLRESVKWDYELRNGEQLETVVDRALAIMKSEPLGPAYLTLPRDVLAMEMERFSYWSESRHAPAAPPAPNPNALAEAASILAAAERPLILTSAAGRDPDVLGNLGRLAERFAIPVIQTRSRFISIATNNPMDLGIDPAPYIGDADAVLAVECPVPWIPTGAAPPPETKIIHLAPDPHFSFIPIRGHACDVALSSATGLGLALLEDAMAELEKGAAVRIDARRKELAQRRQSLLDYRTAQLVQAEIASPMTKPWVSHCVDRIKEADGIVVNEIGVDSQFMRITRPLELFSPMAASGLGSGLGAALGAKLAHPDKLVIGTYGDGAYMFGNPVASHFVGAEMELPILHVVFNNGRWNAVKSATGGVEPGGYAERSNRPPLTYLDAQANYEKVVEVCGGYGERVADPADLPAALERALKAVKVEKRQAVLNVVMA